MACPMPGVIKRVVRARHASLEIAQQGIDPVQLGRLRSLAATSRDMALMHSAHLARLGKAQACNRSPPE